MCFSWNSFHCCFVRQDKCYTFHCRTGSKTCLKEEVSRMPLGSLVCPTEFAGRQGALAGSGGDVSPSFLPVFGALVPCHICHTYHTYSVLNRPIKKSHSTLVKGVLGSILLLLSCIKNGIPPSVSMITHRNDFFFLVTGCIRIPRKMEANKNYLLGLSRWT